MYILGLILENSDYIWVTFMHRVEKYWIRPYSPQRSHQYPKGCFLHVYNIRAVNLQNKYCILILYNAEISFKPIFFNSGSLVMRKC